MAGSKKDRTVLLDGERVAQLMREHGLNSEDLARRDVASAATMSKILNGGHKAYWSTVQNLKTVFKLNSVDDLLPGRDKPARDASRINEWLIDEVQSHWITASNQLQYRIWKLRHEHLPKLARGKFYDLDGMSTDDRERCHASLLRHAVVCTKIGCHTNIISNFSTYESDDAKGWWVIDEWIEGISLRQHLEHVPLNRPTALAFGIAMAEALLVLHANAIVRRELTPQSLLVENGSGRIVLTEFELSKLLDGSPTVSTDAWLVDPYRAPEASSDDVDLRADIYSWGRIMIELMLGELPAVGGEKSALKDSALHPEEEKLLGRCVSVSRRSRPKGFAKVLTELKQWKA